MTSLFDDLRQKEYPGRGIFMGKTACGKRGVMAYFIMGRSENSRNRIFIEDGDGIRTKAFDESRVTDPSFIIYAPVRTLGNKTIVTNGDQTDTIYNGMDRQLTFEQSLRSRTYEGDAPNYTPRISGVLRYSGNINSGGMNYALSIIKREGDDGVSRAMFAYENPPAGEGHLIHTYTASGATASGALMPFAGEPVRVSTGRSVGIDEFTTLLWESLNALNRVSLWVRYIDLADGSIESRIVNKNGADK